MPFNIETWKQQTRQKLHQTKQWLRRRRDQDAPYLLYGYLCSLALWPLAAAAQGGDLLPVMMALGGVAGGVGGNLIAEQIQRWRDQAESVTEEDLARWAADEAGDNPDLRQALDDILAALEIIEQARAGLNESDRQWFRQTLQRELAALGNLARFEAHLSGQGVITQDSALIADNRGVAGSSAEYIITGDGNSVTTIINHYRAESKTAPDEAMLRRQIAGYLQWMIDRHRTIELRGIKREGQQVVQLNLETVYVPLAARAYQGARLTEIALDQVLRQERGGAFTGDFDVAELAGKQKRQRQGRRIAITGGPGSGKTTVLLHLAYTLSQALGTDSPALAEEKLGLTGDLPLPIFAPLSSYAHYLRDLPPGSQGEKRTLAAFISDHLLRRQVSCDLPADFFEQLLRTGQHVLLLLDGLDEVPTEDERAEVRQAIEELLTGRDRMQIIVTCRTAAYKGRAALGQGFQTIEVLPLAKKHLEGLVRQAYADIYHYDAALQQQKGNDLLRAIDRLEEQRRRRFGEETEPLVASPLLIRMLLVVHYSERRLPDQRAELYMKATDAMLLPEYNPDEEVANRIGGLIGESQSVHRELVQHLAFAMHQRGETQGREVDEDELRRILEAHPSYGDLTADFISLTRQRGGLLEERLGQYRFIHLAFQEYLTARYLAETVRSESGLTGVADFLEAGPLLDSWWREPALLVAGYLSIGTPTIAQKFLRRLAWLDDQAAVREQTLPAEVRLAAAELAGSAALEWPASPAALKADLAGRLAVMFEEAALISRARLSIRVAAVDALTRLGDPRPGVIEVDQMEFCYIPPGPFWMGGPDEDEMAGDDEKPLHQMDLPGYWLACYPVMVAQWKTFVDETGHKPVDKDSLADPLNRPARYVTWYEAVNYCEWLTGRWRTAGLLPENWQVRLPGEAEWEKAARGGLTIPAQPILASIASLDRDLDPLLRDNPAPQRRFPWGDNPDPDRANYNETSLGTTSAMGCFPGGKTPYGVEEMSGNLWEWCATIWQENYQDYKNDNDLKRTDALRVMRGGAFYDNAGSVRCAARGRYFPVDLRDLRGFRVVVSPFTSEL